MRIGLFTDTYMPAMNGITYIVDDIKRQLERQGHEVYIFAPAESFKYSVARTLRLSPKEERVIRITSIDGSAFFENMRPVIFFPRYRLNQIKELNLDVIHFFTPSQIGLLGVYAAKKLNIPLVGQHCTDLYRYVEYYPNVLPGILALSILLPFTLPFSVKVLKDVFFLLRPRKIINWNQHLVRESMSLVYEQCDEVIVPSRKIFYQLNRWQFSTPITVMPNGVDALPKPSAKQLNVIRKKLGIDKQNKVILYVGRLTPEKNLKMLIDALLKINKNDSFAKLVYVGESGYKANLKQYAKEKGCLDDVKFTGRLPRQKLGLVYALADVFAFPSQTDTQGLVLHEAAQAGLPLVIVDPTVTEVLVNGQNGFVANPNPTSLAKKIEIIFKNPELAKKFSKQSKKIACMHSQDEQIKKLEDLYNKIIL